MEHIVPTMMDQLFSARKNDVLLQFLVHSMYSSEAGYFKTITMAMGSLGQGLDSLNIIRDLESTNILEPYIPNISRLISHTFPLVRDPRCIFLAVDKYALKKFDLISESSP
jgi:hypothetical protein